jgi:hypothetical protein
LLTKSSSKRLSALTSQIPNCTGSSPLKQKNVRTSLYNNQNNINKNQTKIDNKNNINALKPNDTISISAVTYNNDANLNSSTLELMDNVLCLEGINSNNNVYEKNNNQTVNNGIYGLIENKGNNNDQYKNTNIKNLNQHEGEIRHSKHLSSDESNQRSLFANAIIIKDNVLKTDANEDK